MTDTIDTECMILVAMLKRDVESLKKVREAAADAMLAVYRTAVPLAKHEESLEAMLEGLNQALDKSLELTKALRSLSRRMEKDAALWSKHHRPPLPPESHRGYPTAR